MDQENCNQTLVEVTLTVGLRRGSILGRNCRHLQRSRALSSRGSVMEADWSIRVNPKDL
jgi:hypothetical protein